MNLRKLKDSQLGISRLEQVKDSDVASKLESIDDIFQINGIYMSDRKFDELRDYGKTTVSCGEGWNAEEIVKDLKEFGFKASAHGKRVTVWIDSTKVNDSEDSTSVEVLPQHKEFIERLQNLGYKLVGTENPEGADNVIIYRFDQRLKKDDVSEVDELCADDYLNEFAGDYVAMFKE